MNGIPADPQLPPAKFTHSQRFNDFKKKSFLIIFKQHKLLAKMIAPGLLHTPTHAYKLYEPCS